MALLGNIGPLADLASLALRIWRDPAWSTKAQQIRETPLALNAEFIKKGKELIEANRDGRDADARRTSAEFHTLFLRELAARGNAMVDLPGADNEPGLVLTVSQLAQVFAELTGRRRDAELGELGAIPASKN